MTSLKFMVENQVYANTTKQPFINPQQKRIAQLSKTSKFMSLAQMYDKQPQHLQYPFLKSRDLTLGQNHLQLHNWHIKDSQKQKNKISMQVLQQKKYQIIQRDELKASVMDRSSAYRLKVENDRLSNFFSERTKVSDWKQTLRGACIPDSLKNAKISPMSMNRLSATLDPDQYDQPSIQEKATARS